MKLSNIFILGGAGLLAYLYTRQSAKTFAKSATVSFEKLDFNLKKFQVIVTLGISNPTALAATINSIVGSLYVNNTEVATVQNFTVQKIAGNSMSKINVILKPRGTGIFSTLKALVKSKLKGAKNMVAKFKGAVNINGLPVNVDQVLS